MPSRSVLVTAYRNRTIDLLLSLYESDGSTPFVLAANDNVRVKIGRWQGRAITASPEYEDCLKLADAAGIPVRTVYAAAADAARAAGFLQA